MAEGSAFCVHRPRDLPPLPSRRGCSLQLHWDGDGAPTKQQAGDEWYGGFKRATLAEPDFGFPHRGPPLHEPGYGSYVVADPPADFGNTNSGPRGPSLRVYRQQRRAGQTSGSRLTEGSARRRELATSTHPGAMPMFHGFHSDKGGGRLLPAPPAAQGWYGLAGRRRTTGKRHLPRPRYHPGRPVYFPSRCRTLAMIPEFVAGPTI